jgi:hypothetical protein
LVAVALLAFPALAAWADAPQPEIPEANARFSPTQGCVEPTEDMRKHHMEYILHQRDETMHRGIRTTRHSFKQCINCHVPPPESGKVVRHDDPEHFCNACHTYASVKIDCFQCHRDHPMPGEAITSTLHSSTPPATGGSVLGLITAESQP